MSGLPCGAKRTGNHFDIVMCYLATSINLEFPSGEVGMSDSSSLALMYMRSPT